MAAPAPKPAPAPVASVAPPIQNAGETRYRAPITGEKYDLDRAAFEDLLKRRFFYGPAFAPYQGVAGLYDFGPPGCAVKSNIIALWRKHYVLNDGMLEVDCTVLTPKPVLDASGHTAKFSDYMVRDEKTKTCYRADHVLKGHLSTLLTATDLTPELKHELSVALARVDDLDQKGLTEALRKYKAKAPDTGNDITDPAPFNLMFQTSIGPTGDVVGFLRPETAQGIFVNFKRLLEFNGGKLPFAAAQVGNAFRNEIAPRSGLLRVREFPLAEVEYFVKPSEKTHVSFQSIVKLTPALLPASIQETGVTDPIRPTLGDASRDGVIKSEAIAYFMGRTYLFVRSLGIPDEHIRFRQHLRSEMAHYAADCWDCELRTSYGWIECVGHADRGCWDLSRHTKFSAQDMSVHDSYKDGPRMVDRLKLSVKKQVVGQKYRKEAQPLIQHLEQMNEQELGLIKQALDKDGVARLPVKVSETALKEFEVTRDMITIEMVREKVTGESFMPHVIEPSFGIGRILYCTLEHAYWVRPEDKDRGVLSFPTIIAPIKLSVFPLQNDDRFGPVVSRISSLLTDASISHKVDDSGAAIGRRYARTDELGIPFAVTVDYNSLDDNTVTLRDRDSTRQIRLPIDVLVQTAQQLLDQRMTWAEVETKFPKCVVKDS